MAQAVKLADMRLAARRRAGQETLDVENAFVSEAELDVVLNDWLQHVYRLLVRARSGYYRSSLPITTVSGQSLYPLEVDFLELISVDWTFSTTDIVPIYPYQEEERNVYRSRPGWLRNYPIYYQLQNQSINFIPTPITAYPITVNYVPVFTKLKDPDDVFDGVAGFEEFAICKAAAYMCIKDDNSEAAGFHEAQAGVIEKEIMAMAPQRTAGLRRVPRVRKARRYGWGHGW